MMPELARPNLRVRSGWAVLWTALFLQALALAAPPPQVQQRFFRDGNSWIQEVSGPLVNEKGLNISHFVGSVRIAAGAPTGTFTLRVRSDEPQEKDARRQMANYHFVVGQRPGAAVIQGTGAMNLDVGSELTIQLPPKAESVHVDTLAGGISIKGKVAHLDLQSHGGDIEIDEAELLQAVTMGGSVVINHHVVDSIIRTGGGDIRIDASTGDLDITSLGGNIWLKAIARAQVQSGGGNIEVVRSKGTLQIHSAGGNIKLGEMDGDVVAETGGGNIYVGVAHGTVVANTALGNIQLWKLAKGAAAHTGMGRITAEFVGNRDSIKNSELISLMGDIVVYFAGASPANVHAITVTCPGRQIHSDFPGLKLTSGVDGPRSAAAEGTIHGGGPAIELRTMAGQIEIRRAQ
jgi:hypothetical protein